MKVFFTILIGIIYSYTIYKIMIREGNKILLNLHNIMACAFLVVYFLLFPIAQIIAINKQFVSYHYTNYIMAFSYWDLTIYFLSIFAATHAFLAVLRKEEKGFWLKFEDIKQKIYSKTRRNQNAYIDSVLIPFTMLMIGAVSELLYVHTYGGYFKYLDYSLLLRAGRIAIDNPFGKLGMFRKCSIMATYLFFCQMFENKKLKPSNAVGFVISLFFSIRVLYADRGRLAFLSFIVMLCLIGLCRAREWKYFDKKTMIYSLGAGTAFLVFSYIMGIVLGRNASSNILAQIVSEFSFIFVCFKAVLNKACLKTFRYFIDLFLFPIYLLPSSWWTRWGVSPASKITTIFTYGVPKGVEINGEIHGELPADFISISYMQLGLVGVIILPIVYAILIKIIFNLIKDIQNQNVKKMLTIYFGYEMLWMVFYADPKNIILGLLSFVVYGVLKFIYGYLKIDDFYVKVKNRFRK